MVAVRDKIATRADVRRESFASLPNPGEDLIDGAKFPGGAGGPHGTDPGGAGGGCDYWLPKRLGLRRAREGNVIPQPAGPLGSAEPSVNR